MSLNFLKPWEFSKIIIIIYIKLIMNLKNIKTELILLLSIIYIIIHTKIDFFSQHIIFIYKLQKILITHIIPLIINKIIIINKILINKYIYFQIFINKIIYINIIINFLNNISIIKFYIMINKYIYKLIKILNIFIYFFYWLIIFNLKIKESLKKKIFIINLEIINKILLGNYIYFNNKEIYNIYKICGNFDKITIVKDQQITSMFIWLINSMMLLINIINL